MGRIGLFTEGWQGFDTPSPPFHVNLCSVLMLLRLLVVLVFSFPVAGMAAEIYTFGKRGDGTRYIKNVDRPVKAREDAAAAAKGKPGGQLPPPVSSPRPATRPAHPLPPPIPDRQKLDLLDKPI